ncbi:MFS general substrate transporter [Gonapodya prolifera JEL478]|uniref:MFS general substrate transporter n=1 Tax=Gonapodya prolifera (strain JEL478) TaxID=1344416 RepID=A0A139A7R6_GONPJ|nr:MFS general substrate transporter [Gonapodya prolifera JEL478]|eukprot:KXS12846.1 MFS general substrate transporter [Gonapodya prolifera JEL478]
MYSSCTPILPRIVLAHLKRTQEDLGFLYSLYPLTSLVANPAVGWLADAMFPYSNGKGGTRLEPRRRIIVFGVGLMLLTAMMFSFAENYCTLCVAKMLHAVVDAIVWILGLSIWERYCRVMEKEATAEKGPKAVHQGVNTPSAAFGESLILASNWIGQVVSLPLAGYLFNSGLWVFAPVVVLSVVLLLGWCEVDFGIQEDTSSSQNGFEIDATHPLLAPTPITTVDSLLSHPTVPPHSSQRSSINVFSRPMILASVPVFLSIFVSSGLEPTLPSHLHFRFNASPSDVGGFYMVWSVAYICGLLLAGRFMQSIERSTERSDDPSQREQRSNKGLLLILYGLVASALIAPLVAVPGSSGKSPELPIPNPVSQPLHVKLLELCSLALLGLALGFTLAPTLPELNRVAKATLLPPRHCGKSGCEYESANEPLVPDGENAPEENGTIDDDIGATLYGWWLLVYSVGMMVSEPLSAHVFASYGFLSQMCLNSVLLLFVGVPGIAILIRMERGKEGKETDFI